MTAAAALTGSLAQAAIRQFSTQVPKPASKAQSVVAATIISTAVVLPFVPPAIESKHIVNIPHTKLTIRFLSQVLQKVRTTSLHTKSHSGPYSVWRSPWSSSCKFTMPLQQTYTYYARIVKLLLVLIRDWRAVQRREREEAVEDLEFGQAVAGQSFSH